jgi:hypothetical protein
MDYYLDSWRALEKNQSATSYNHVGKTILHERGVPVQERASFISFVPLVDA